MRSIMIPDNSYGDATPRLRNTIAKCQSIKWFMSEVQPGSINYINRQIESFSLRIHELVRETPSRFDLNWIEGDWSLLHQHRWGSDPYFPWGHRFDDSMRILEKLTRNIKATITRSAELLSLIKPPLWPIIGNPNISGAPVIAHEDILLVSGLALRYDSHDWRVAWRLLCQAESYLWSHLLYDLLGEDPVHMNPFDSLLNICATGYLPLGWENSCFCIYRWAKL